jgi:purine nucleosidase
MKMILDMDTGVDDAVAIALALGSRGVDVVAITSVAGNVPVELCTRNCLLLNELLGGGAVVAAGSDRPIAKRLLTASEVHGADGLGGRTGSLPEPSTSPTDEPAFKLLTRLPLERPDEITLVTTGPLTNVAMALRENPDAVASYARIISMGGAFDVPGNTGPVAEFNVYVDPEAADAVLSSGLDITLVPLDATTGAVLMRSALETRERSRGLPLERPGRNLAAILHRALDHYMEFQFNESGLDGGYMHDPLAVAAALDPDILETRNLHVDVITHGSNRGRTVRAPAQANAATRGRGVRVAFGHDDGAFRQAIEERVLLPVFGPSRTP